MSRTYRQSIAGKLRARFHDDNGFPVTPSSPSLVLTKPDGSTQSISSINVLSTGLLEANFTPDQEGEWVDTWSGTILGESVSVELQFTVVAAGGASAVPTMSPNYRITVTIDDLTPLQFHSTLSPMFTDVRKVRTVAGVFTEGVPDLLLEEIILEASLDALSNRWDPTVDHAPTLTQALREYVTWSSIYVLLTGKLQEFAVTRKALGDFEVEWDQKLLDNFLKNTVIKKMDKYLLEIQTGGDANFQMSSRITKVGQESPDFLTRSREVLVNPCYPGANTLVRYNKKDVQTFIPRTTYGFWYSDPSRGIK